MKGRYPKSGRPTGQPSLELAPRMTQDECAALLGISRTRVQQIEYGALKKLRKGLAAWAPESWRKSA